MLPEPGLCAVRSRDSHRKSAIAVQSCASCTRGCINLIERLKNLVSISGESTPYHYTPGHDSSIGVSLDDMLRRRVNFVALVNLSISYDLLTIALARGWAAPRFPAMCFDEHEVHHGITLAITSPAERPPRSRQTASIARDEHVVFSLSSFAGTVIHPALDCSAVTAQVPPSASLDIPPIALRVRARDSSPR